jgi:cysteinyl-tRNA synthetase
MIKLYNTLSRKKEPLKTRSTKKISLFVCGPTVYDLSHLGHGRTYISFDAFVRFLKSQGYKVDYLQNITDIDDKIIQRAKETRVTAKTLARRFEKEYLKDMKALGILSVSKYARATDHIPEIIVQIEKLLKKGYAYELEGDGIYYDILKFKDYGKLSRRTSLQAEDAVSRIDESIKKQNKGDFALWKISKKGEPKWKSPWGWGRPGWHIEDTAITEKRFGSQYDLHGGARDLIFPHHEAEIAQMEAISGKNPMAKYWMHSGFLTVEGMKMSKSLGNFITIQDFLNQHSVRILRLLVLKAHYRSPIDYSDKLLKQTKRELERIDEFIERLKLCKGKTKTSFPIKKFRKDFISVLDDDFNTPKAIAVLFNVVVKGNTARTKEVLSEKNAKEILFFLKEIDSIFGFIFFGRPNILPPPNVILELAEKRENFRRRKDWQSADRMRKTLIDWGWEVDDTPKGPRLKKIS